MNQAVVGTFGEPSASPVTFASAGGAFVEVAGVFEAAGRRLDVSDGVAVESVAPRLFVRCSALGFVPTQGDRWAKDGVTYRVTGVDPDGYGGYLLTGRRDG